MYLVGCFQGRRPKALRSIQQPTHFSDFVISHSHLTVFGTFVVWAIAGTLYVVPKLAGRELWSFALGKLVLLLITLGISLMGLDPHHGRPSARAIALMSGVEWLDAW